MLNESSIAQWLKRPSGILKGHGFDSRLGTLKFVLLSNSTWERLFIRFCTIRKGSKSLILIPLISPVQVNFYRFMKISASKASGVDNISARFLRIAATVCVMNIN